MATDVTGGVEQEPWERTSSIAALVERTIELDLEPVKAELLEKLEEPSDAYIWPRAERIAGDSIRSTWGPALVDQCAAGLAAARLTFLETAERCLLAAEELAEHGLESWIAGAVLHRLAHDVCWDSLDERHGVQWFECDDGQGE